MEFILILILNCLSLDASAVEKQTPPKILSPQKSTSAPVSEEVISINTSKSEVLKILERIPETFKQAIPGALKKDLERHRKQFLSDPHLVASSADMAVLRFTYDDGEANFLLHFDKAGNLLGALYCERRAGVLTTF